MTDHSRPPSALRQRGRWLALLVVALAWAAAVSWRHPPAWQASYSPSPAPHALAFRLAALGDATAAGVAAAIYIQTFDAQAGRHLSLRNLDFPAVDRWLRLSQTLAPRIGHAPFMAANLFAPLAPSDQSRRLLDGVSRAFETAPERHWPWLAQATHVARHDLDDLMLARSYARALRHAPAAIAIPAWARDLEFFVLADLGELDAARALLGGIVASGRAEDPRAMEAMLSRLRALEAAQSTDERHKVRASAAENRTDEGRSKASVSIDSCMSECQ